MKYGPFKHKGTRVRTRTPDMRQSTPLILWALDHDSSGLFHYYTDMGDVDYITWMFEKEEDATLFALKFT